MTRMRVCIPMYSGRKPSPSVYFLRVSAGVTQEATQELLHSSFLVGAQVLSEEGLSHSFSS